MVWYGMSLQEMLITPQSSHQQIVLDQENVSLQLEIIPKKESLVKEIALESSVSHSNRTILAAGEIVPASHHWSLSMDGVLNAFYMRPTSASWFQFLH